MEEIKKQTEEYDEYITKRLEKCEADIKSLKDSITELESDIHGYKEKVENINHEIEAQKAALQEANKGKLYREEILQRRFPDTYQAVVWLRENKQLFSGKVFEPMALEINVPQPEHSKYFESIIPKPDLLAFICEDKRDMQILISKLREEKKLKINIVHSGHEHPPSSFFQPDIPIEHLSEFGFVAYMKQLISAPEQIMKYLCRVLQIHKIPIGSQLTNDMYEDVPEAITMFCSDDTKYEMKKSKYSGLRVTASDTIEDSTFLNIPVNLEEYNIQGKLETLQREKDGTMQLLSKLEGIKDTTKRELEGNERYLQDLRKLADTHEESSD